MLSSWGRRNGHGRLRETSARRVLGELRGSTNLSAAEGRLLLIKWEWQAIWFAFNVVRVIWSLETLRTFLGLRRWWGCSLRRDIIVVVNNYYEGIRSRLEVRFMNWANFKRCKSTRRWGLSQYNCLLMHHSTPSHFVSWSLVRQPCLRVSPGSRQGTDWL